MKFIFLEIGYFYITITIIYFVLRYRQPYYKQFDLVGISFDVHDLRTEPCLGKVWLFVLLSKHTFTASSNVLL